MLLCGDNETIIFQLAACGSLIETCLNFSQTPSVAVLVEATPKESQALAEQARSLGVKAGVYASLDKGISWLYKVMNVTIKKE